MKGVEVFFRQDAESDALSYYQYIRERNPDAATRFLEAIDRTVEELALNPLKGRARLFRGRDLRNIRSWRVSDFENYLIFYRITGKQLEILHIKHGAMNFPHALRRS